MWLVIISFAVVQQDFIFPPTSLRSDWPCAPPLCEKAFKTLPDGATH